MATSRTAPAMPPTRTRLTLRAVRAGATWPGCPPVLATIADLPLLSAPTVRDVMGAVDGTRLWGDEAALDREVEDILVGGMNPEHILERLSDGQLCIAASDRVEILLTLIAAHTSDRLPTLSGVVLNALTVGRGAVVGGSACVVRDVASGTVVKGVPAR